jgi:hypothetical protein
MGQPRRSPKVQPTTFVKLPPPLPALVDQGTLELHRPSGSRLTLRLPQARAQELLPLIGLFLRQGV